MTLARNSGRFGLLAIAVITSPFAAAENSGWYAGANIGRSRADIDDGRIISGLQRAGVATTSFSDDNRDVGFKLFGGYQLNKNFALEGGYFDLGKFGFTANTAPPGSLTGEFKFRGVNLDAVGILPLHEKFSLFGRVGMQYAQTRDSFSSTGAAPAIFGSNPSKRELNYKFGLGVQYDFTETLGMRVEAERYRLNDAIGSKGNVDLISVGLVYRFGGKVLAAAPRAEVVAPPPQAVVAPPPQPVAREAVVAPPTAAQGLPPQEAVTPPPAPVQAPARRDRN
jgi:OOP family OmpA-OmpF porin